MRDRTGFRRIIDRPIMVVLGVLAGAGAAKAGHGVWAALGILTYVTAALTFIASRSLSAAAGGASMPERA